MKIFKRTVGLIHKLSFRFGENVHMAQTKQNKSINNKTKANQELVMGTHKTKKEKKKRTLQLYTAAVSESVRQSTFYTEVNTSEWLIVVQWNSRDSFFPYLNN